MWLRKIALKKGDLTKGRAIALIGATAVSALILTVFVAGDNFLLFSFPPKLQEKDLSLGQPQQQEPQQKQTPAGQPAVRDILLIADETTVMVAPTSDLHPGGIWYNAMTFNGTIPGPAIFANQGDTLRITLTNQGEIVHSLNFHAGFGPSQAISGVVRPHETKTWTLKADYPGAFLYHCDGDNLNGIWEHIASGMYGGMIVHPPSSEEGGKPAKEFYVVFGEVYDDKVDGAAPFLTSPSRSMANGTSTTSGTNLSGNGNTVSSSSNSTSDIRAAGSFDLQKFVERKPDLVLTNGMAYKYIPWIGADSKIILNKNAQSFHVKVGELTRWYIFNAGPRNAIAFNFGAGMLHTVLNGGSGTGAANNTSGLDAGGETWDPRGHIGYDEVASIPPGSGSTIEVVFPEAGTYFGNDHDVGSLLYGAGFVVIAQK
jgi:nitrite reductase (NO-forming)